MERIYRKLQKIGGSLVISLPKKWTENYELNAGSSIGMEVQNDGTLLIMPKMEQAGEVIKDEIVLESKSDDFINLVVWDLLKKSLSGETNITIISEKEISKNLRETIRYFVERLPNTEITKETNQKIIIQNFGYKKIPTKTLIRRLLSFVVNMFEDLRHQSKSDLDYNYNQLKKFYFILVIHIRTYLRTGVYISEDTDFTPLEAMDYRMFCEKIKEISDILKDFTLSKHVIDYYKKIEQYFSEVEKAFRYKDDKLAYMAWLKKGTLLQESRNLMKNLDYEDKDRIKSMLNIIQHIKDMAALI